ncbi:MAG: FHA domain-containing protein, partial [Magnetococcales bacterium]|nr:FHA domain-containing protein [Magnetococcales bacterium]
MDGISIGSIDGILQSTGRVHHADIFEVAGRLNKTMFQEYADDDFLFGTLLAEESLPDGADQKLLPQSVPGYTDLGEDLAASHIFSFAAFRGACSGGHENGYTLGSSTSSCFVVDDESLAEQHCKIILRDGKVFLKDLGSSAGTRVNGQRCGDALLEIQEGDDILAGRFLFG